MTLSDAVGETVLADRPEELADRRPRRRRDRAAEQRRGDRAAARAASRPTDAADPAEMGDRARSVPARLGAGDRPRRGLARRGADRRKAHVRSADRNDGASGPAARAGLPWPGFPAPSIELSDDSWTALTCSPLLSVPGRRRDRSRGSATSRIMSPPIPTCSTITACAIRRRRGPRSPDPGPAAAAGRPARWPSTHRQRLRRGLGAEPDPHRARAALPADDPRLAGRRPARRPARRLPLRPGRGARRGRSPSARPRWSRTAPA